MTKNKNVALSWESFQAMGNPENVEPLEEEVQENDKSALYNSFTVRIWLDKKHRKGKMATIIKGIELDDDDLKALCKEIKTMCGVGGSAKDGEIIIQGDQRQRALNLIIEKGFSGAKLAGG